MAHKHQWLNHGVLFAAALLVLFDDQGVSNCMSVYVLALTLILPRWAVTHSKAAP